MKRILPLLIVGILVLGGLGAVAVPDEDTTSEILLQPKLEIMIKGGLLGYTVNVKNVGNETIKGTLNMTITTNATIMILGDELSYDSFGYDMDAGEYVKFKWGPVIGFGPATINVEGIFSPGGWGFEAEANGIILLFYVLCSKTTFNIP